MKKEIIKMYPCYPLQLLDSSYYVIMRLDVVKKQFVILGDYYATKEDCEAEVNKMNKESGPVEFEYEI